MTNGGRLKTIAGMVFQPLHRHADPRLIVFTQGAYVERSFQHRTIFEPGEFVIRPSFFCHDGLATGGALYLKLGLTGTAARNYFTNHGWTGRRGQIELEILTDLCADPAAGDTVLATTPTFPLGDDAGDGAMAMIASALGDLDPPPLCRLAEAHGLEAWELSRRFRRAYGLSPSRYRREARIQRALLLLAESGEPLSKVAAEAGFADQSHFHRELQRIIGLTPAAARTAIAH